MRIAILAVIAIGCGGRTGAPAAAPPPAADVPATRWVPATPTYLFASRTAGDAQRSLRDAIDLLGSLAGYDLRDATRAVSGLLGVDALHPEPLAAIGVDLRGSWAMFSDTLSPTLVVHLAAPAQMTAFLDHQRERGLVTQSVIVDGTEVFSATLIAGLKLSWAIAGDWMWIHVALPFAHEDGTSWFTASHAPHAASWGDDWVWAQRAAGAAAGVVGYFGRGAIAHLASQLPDAITCTKLVESVGRAAVSLDGDDHRFSARVALDVGSTAALRGMVLPPPSGWEATAARAAFAVQWNLDLAAARTSLAPRLAACVALAGGALAKLDETGVRTARAALLGFDPENSTGSGAIALDIASAAFFERQLDRIPLRRAIERGRTFGTHKGASIAIPFSVTIEYVLEPRLAIIALGDGVLAGLFAPGSPGPAPIFALDIAPPAMSAEAWGAVLHGLSEQTLSGSPGPTTRRVVEHLMRWRDGHFSVTAEPTELVIAVSGNRR